MPSYTAAVLPEQPCHAAAIEALAAAAFGPGRFAKTAYRLREGTAAIAGLCFVASIGGRLVGSIRLSPITIGGSPALLLGPLVVDPAHKSHGHGLALMRAAIAAAAAEGHALIMLVGDEPYYARAGFSKIPRGRVRLPGPVDPDRLLALELVPGALAAVGGMARPAPAVSAALAVPGGGEGRQQQGEPREAGEQRHRVDAAQDGGIARAQAHPVAAVQGGGRVHG